MILDQRWDEILVIPDILCNAGGVIVSYFEWVQDLQNFFWNETEIADKLFRIMDTAFSAVVKRAQGRENLRPPRGAWPSRWSGCSRPSRRAGCSLERRAAGAQ